MVAHFGSRHCLRLFVIGAWKLFTLITVCVLAQPSLFAQTESSIKNVFWQPNDLQPGSVTFVRVELNRKATKVFGQFLGKDLLFFYSGKAGVWYSLAGVDVETMPGAYDLRIRVTLPGGQVARSVKPVEIGTVTFPGGVAVEARDREGAIRTTRELIANPEICLVQQQENISLLQRPVP